MNDVSGMTALVDGILWLVLGGFATLIVVVVAMVCVAIRRGGR